MAVATSMAIMGGIGLAKGAYDTVQASKEKKKRQAELDAYQRQKLEDSNVYKKMQISTIGSDLMREESSRNIATAMNSIGNAGTRAIIGATPKLVAEQNNVDRAIQKELDDQVQKRDYAIAGDDAQIRGMQEQREYQDLAGLGNAIDTARQDQNMGMNTMLNGLMAGASGMSGSIGGGAAKANSAITPASAITPIGIQKTAPIAIQAPKYQLPQTFGSVLQGPLNYEPAPSFMNNFNSIGFDFKKQNSFNLNTYMNSLKPVKL